MLFRGMCSSCLAICVWANYYAVSWHVFGSSCDMCVGQVIVLFHDMYLGCLAMCIWAYDCVVSWDVFGLSCDVYLGKSLYCFVACIWAVLRLFGILHFLAYCVAVSAWWLLLSVATV